MQALFLRVITLSLGCSAVLLPLLLLSRLIRRRYAARTCYFLWLLVAFRLLLPVSLTLPEPVVTVEAPGYAVSLRRLEAPIPEYAAPGSSEGASGAAPSDPVTLPADGVPTAAEPVSKVPLTELLAVLWLAGGAAFLLWQGGTYLMVRRRLLSRAVSAEETELALLRRQQSELGLHRSVELRRVEGLPTPMMLGLLRPVILLPAAWLEEDALSIGKEAGGKAGNIELKTVFCVDQSASVCLAGKDIQSGITCRRSVGDNHGMIGRRID